MSTATETTFRNALVAAFAKAAEIGAISKDGKRKKVAKGKWEWIKKLKGGKSGESAKTKAKEPAAANLGDKMQAKMKKVLAKISGKPTSVAQPHSEPPPDAAKHWGSKAQPFYRPGPNPTVDTVVTRDGPNGKRQVLLIQRATKNKHGEPVAEGGKWAIPGGFHDSDSQRGQPWRPGKETAQEAALRELTEETGLDAGMVAKSLRHTGKYGDESKPTGRDPRDNKEAWSVSNAFALHLPKELAKAGAKVKGLDDAENAKWFDVDEAGKLPLAFDHSRILGDALKGSEKQKSAPKAKAAASESPKKMAKPSKPKADRKEVLWNRIKKALKKIKPKPVVLDDKVASKFFPSEIVLGDAAAEKFFPGGSNPPKSLKHNFRARLLAAFSFKEQDHPRGPDGKFVEGAGGGGSAGGGGISETPSSGESKIETPELTAPGTDVRPWSAKALEFAKKAFNVWKMTQLSANAAQSVAKEAGASEKLANIAWGIAAVGDIPVPGVPIGSLSVMAAASVFKPSAGWQALKKLPGAIKGLAQGVAKKLGLTKKPDYVPGEPHGHAPWTAGGSDGGLEHEQEELKRRGYEPDEVAEMVKAVEAFTIGSTKIRAAQRGVFQGSDKDRRKYEELGYQIEAYISAKGPFDPEQPIMRGMTLPKDSLAQFKPGAKVDPGNCAVSSWTTNPKVSAVFSKSKNPGDESVVFTVLGGAKRSASVKHMSKFRQEDEVIVGKGSNFEVTSTEMRNGVMHVVLRESAASATAPQKQGGEK